MCRAVAGACRPRSASGGRGEMLAGRGRGHARRADQVRLWATADVTVDGRNVSNVVLTLQQGMSVVGARWSSKARRHRRLPI